MAETLIVRPAARGDIAAIDALLARSYPVLLKPDYPPSVMVTALPLISRAQPALVECGTYFVVESPLEGVVGAGGWSRAAPGRAGRDRRPLPPTGHVRHVVTDHRMTRRGIGRQLMEHVLGDAAAAGMAALSCLSTRTAVPFYAAMGFVVVGPRDVQLRPGIVFPAIEMRRSLGG